MNKNRESWTGRCKLNWNVLMRENAILRLPRPTSYFIHCFFFLREIKSNHLLSLAIKQNRKTGIQKNNIKKELLFFNDVGSTYIFHSYLSSSVQFDILDCLGRRETWRTIKQILFQSFMRGSTVSSSSMDRNVPSMTLSNQHFLCRPRCRPLSMVPWRIVFEEALVAPDMPEPSEFPSLDSYPNRFLWAREGSWPCSEPSRRSCAPSWRCGEVSFLRCLVS